MHTDSKWLFDENNRTALTTEKRLLVETMAVSEACSGYEAPNVGLNAGESNPVDRFTKPNTCTELNKILHRGIDTTKVTLRIYRINEQGYHIWPPLVWGQ